MTLRPATAAVLLLGCLPGRADDYPKAVLTTDGLAVTVYLPDADNGFYRGSRFDWAGMLGHVRFAGHTLFTPWLGGGKHDPTFHSAALGPCEEFGTETPLGYADAPVGGTFLKIGVGELKKAKAEPYTALAGHAIVRPGRWKVDREGDRLVRFTQEAKTADGYGYGYEKTVSVAPPATLSIAHRLRNTGGKRIETDVFNHNFFNVDADPVGPDYSLRLPFPATADGPKERFTEVVELSGHELRLRKPLDTGSVYGGLTGFGRDTPAGFTLRHRKSGVRVVVAGTAPLSKFNLWGMKPCLCPEPFHAIDLPPGREMTWMWTYRFEADK